MTRYGIWEKLSNTAPCAIEKPSVSKIQDLKKVEPIVTKTQVSLIPKKITNRFPIEDSLLLSPPLLKDTKLEYPELSFDFHLFKNEHVATLLQVWDFLGIFQKPLKLSPFTLDQFIQSMCYSSSPNPILVESFGSLLTLACSEYSLNKKLSESTNLPSQSSNDDEVVDVEDFITKD